jgi:hypothetical protein
MSMGKKHLQHCRKLHQWARSQPAIKMNSNAILIYNQERVFLLQQIYGQYHIIL